MSTITYFTKKQLEIERLIINMGFKVRAEVDIEQYRADLFINELSLIIEIDGPSHRKLKKEGKLVNSIESAMNKRDKILLQYAPSGIWHIPVDIEDDIFEEEFKKILGKINEKWVR